MFCPRHLPIVLVIMVGCGSMEEFRNPEAVYQATFGATPGPGITLLQANGRSFRDSSDCYLRLRVTPAAFATLTGPVFLPMTRAEYVTEGLAMQNPGPMALWWAPLKDAPTVFLRSGQFHPTHSSGRALVAYDPTNQIANFCWSGID